MRAVPKPAFDAVKTFVACTRRMRGRTNDEYQSAITEIARYAVDYDAAGGAGSLYAIAQSATVGPVLDADDMQKVYERGMVAGSGRPIYDALISKSRNCPLCAHRQSSTLDHYLPKRVYPALAVTPANLVPCCKDCNFLKREHIAGSPDKQTLHPYFDNIGAQTWLQGRLDEVTPPVVVFRVHPPNGVSATFAARVEHHFDTFDLGALYASQAATELVYVRYEHNRLFERAGADALREHLELQVESRERINANSWQAAMYRALAKSAWYWTGQGF